jgi:PEP-CTERM motif
MHRRITVFLLFSLFFASPARSSNFFATATMGPTGAGGYSVSFRQSIGARFQVTSPIVTTEIGGHFFGLDALSFFGAIVRLSGPLDVPDSITLSTPDLVAFTLFFPNNSLPISAELSRPLVAALDPGWYVLVFGGGSLGADSTGTTLLVGGNPEIGDPSYITRNLGNQGLGWFEPNDLSNVRMFVNAVPEPGTATLLGIGLLTLGIRGRRRSRPTRSCS